MVALPEEQTKWDLMTTSRELEDLVLKEYPGRIFEHQIMKIPFGEKKAYIFTGLDQDVLFDFLDKHGQAFRYNVVGSAGHENECEAYSQSAMNVACQ